MPEIKGELTGIRSNKIKELEEIYQLSVPYGQVITAELAEHLARLSTQLNREIAVYVTRRGQIISVSLGDTHTVSLPDYNGREAKHRLSGIRCIHTHPNGDSRLSQVDVASLKTMHFDLMAAIGATDEKVTDISIGLITGLVDDQEQVEFLGPLLLKTVLTLDLSYLLKVLESELQKSKKTYRLAEEERAILVGLESKNNWDPEDSLAELSELAKTAGAKVVGGVLQRKDRPDYAFFIGRGKVQELSLLIQERDANLVIFDDELSPAQQRNLEQTLGTKIVDRSGLILDIFAQRARTHEGKLQVELAQLKYQLPRLGGQGLVLSRLGGGIGTRGPGETKLEVDRRHIRSRIHDIETEIEKIKKQRSLYRDRREKNRLAAVALVGYTNAGKSTVLNALTGADVVAENKLFATLDPTSRKICLPSGREVLLTDTVGFIKKLPHQLIAAFRATLEEVVQADLLLHVIDASQPHYQEQNDAVWQVLRELGAENKPTITLFNKIDRINEPATIERMTRLADSMAISALTLSAGEDRDKLLSLIEKHLPVHSLSCTLCFPYEASGEAATLYELAQVEETRYEEQGMIMVAKLPLIYYERYQQYILEMNKC